MVFLPTFVHLPDFLQAGLDGEVGLSKSDDFFSGVCILDDEVAGVAGELDTFYRSFASFADFDHFEDILEMIGRNVAAVLTGFFCPFDSR